MEDKLVSLQAVMKIVGTLRDKAQPATGSYGSTYSEAQQTCDAIGRAILLLPDEEKEMKDTAKIVADMRALAAKIHCPDTEGGKYAAGIKAELLALADRLEAEGGVK